MRQNLILLLVLAPDQMMLQIHESVGHPLELDLDTRLKIWNLLIEVFSLALLLVF